MQMPSTRGTRIWSGRAGVEGASVSAGGMALGEGVGVVGMVEVGRTLDSVAGRALDVAVGRTLDVVAGRAVELGVVAGVFVGRGGGAVGRTLEVVAGRGVGFGVDGGVAVGRGGAATGRGGEATASREEARAGVVGSPPVEGSGCQALRR